MTDIFKNHFLNWLKLDQEENESVQQSKIPQRELKSPTEVAFENDELRLIVEKGLHKRQKTFRVQDHMFYLKIELKNKTSPMPLLMDILDFLHAGFVHVLDSVATFYEKGTQTFC